MDNYPICFYCSRYKGFTACDPLSLDKQCDDSNNWKYYKRKTVMVYTPCLHCAKHTVCEEEACNRNSKWPKFKKRDDYDEISIHDRPAWKMEQV